MEVNKIKNIGKSSGNLVSIHLRPGVLRIDLLMDREALHPKAFLTGSFVFLRLGSRKHLNITVSQIQEQHNKPVNKVKRNKQALPERLPWMPESVVTLDGGLEATGAQEIDQRDQLGRRGALD